MIWIIVGVLYLAIFVSLVFAIRACNKALQLIGQIKQDIIYVNRDLLEIEIRLARVRGASQRLLLEAHSTSPTHYYDTMH